MQTFCSAIENRTPQEKISFVLFRLQDCVFGNLCWLLFMIILSRLWSSHSCMYLVSIMCLNFTKTPDSCSAIFERRDKIVWNITMSQRNHNKQIASFRTHPQNMQRSLHRVTVMPAMSYSAALLYPEVTIFPQHGNAEEGFQLGYGEWQIYTYMYIYI